MSEIVVNCLLFYIPILIFCKCLSLNSSILSSGNENITNNIALFLYLCFVISLTYQYTFPTALR